MYRTRVLLAVLMLYLAGSSSMVFAQATTDDDAIRALVQAETVAFYARNFDAWQAGWLHDSKSTRTIIGSNMYFSERGWDEIGANMVKLFKENPRPDNAEAKFENFIVHANGGLASVQYDQLTTRPPDPARRSRQHRVLMKADGRWKIVSQISVSTESFGTTPAAMEESLNTNAYRLLQAGKVNEAIALFKLNVQFYPQSWNVYDSLGEAYATAGNNALAIENYEKSVQLNPKNDVGLAALAKLKGK